MSRRRTAETKSITPDANYKSVVIAKFINCIMLNGKKAKAEKIVYDSIINLSDKVKKEPVEAFEEIVDNIRPLIEVKSRRVGGATYQVPMEVRSARALSLALKWLANAARCFGLIIASKHSVMWSNPVLTCSLNPHVSN